MEWGRGAEANWGEPARDENETVGFLGWKVTGCVPDCDRVTFDCQHIRLHRARRVGIWHEGRWIDHTQLYGAADRRVGPQWAKTANGRDADIRHRSEAGESQERIAALYGINRSSVSRIVNGNHQRPLGRYGDGGHVKRMTQGELDRIARELAYLLDERDASLQRIRSREEAAYSSLTHDYFWNGKQFVSIGK